ncbi:MAG TPA: HAD family hydrolase, partial [Armatimonadota bacterium]
MPESRVRGLFVDIGGVLLTNGWDHHARQRAAERFGLDYQEMQSRHRRLFDSYERGGITLEEYLGQVVFFSPRTFSIEEFRAFMLEQSQPYPDMLAYLAELKRQHGLKVTAVSNEGRELTLYRIERYQLSSVIDFFVSSCFVHLSKPDPKIYRMALDMAQVPIDQALYLEDRTE